ncbi:MAG: hypothetical protein ABL958_11575, partial [Bdellovibrionia bacterium]
MLRRAFLFIIAISVVGACAQRDSKQRPSDTAKLGPRLKDTRLDLSETPERIRQLTSNRTEAVDTVRVFESFEALTEIGRRLGSRGLEAAGHSLIQSFYADSSNYSTVVPSQNLYLEAALGEKWPVLQNLIAKSERDLVLSLDAVGRAAEETTATTKDSRTLTVALEAIIAYLVNLGDEFRIRGASASVVNAYMAKFRSKFLPVFEKLKAPFAELDAGLGIEEALNTLDGVIQALNAGLADKPLEFDLKPARKLSKKISKINSAETALDVLIDVWLMMSAEKRREVFYAQSSDLHDFLSSLTPDELRELQMGPSAIRSPILYLARGRRILPALEKFGIAKFREKLDLSAGQFVAAQLKTGLNDMAASLGPRVTGLVIDEIRAKLKQVQEVRKDEKKYFTEMAIKWGKREIFTTGDFIPAIEKSVTKIKILDGKVGTAPADSPEETVAVTATLAKAMRASVQRWSALEVLENTSFESPEFYRLVLGQLNKLLAVSGFRDHQKNLYSSYHFSAEGDAGSLLDLRAIGSYDGRYGVPDVVVLGQEGFSVDRKATIDRRMNYSVSSQAALLSAVSELAVYFRDWKQNGFDRRMGRFTLLDVIPTLDPVIGLQSLFPKEKLLEVNLGVGCVILKNLMGPRSG